MIFANNLLTFDRIHMLNLYHLMINSVYTSGFKHPCSVGAKKKMETCSTKGSCQTILVIRSLQVFCFHLEIFLDLNVSRVSTRDAK